MKIKLVFYPPSDPIGADCLDFANILADYGLTECRYWQNEGRCEVVIEIDEDLVLDLLDSLEFVSHDGQLVFHGDIRIDDAPPHTEWGLVFEVAENLDV